MIRKYTALLLAISLLLSAVPAFAGGPDGPNVWYSLILVEVVNDRGKQIEKPLGFGPDGFQIKPGMLVKVKMIVRGQSEEEPKGLTTRYYVEPSSGVKCEQVNRRQHIWKITGAGRIYFHTSTTSSDFNFQRISQAEALVADQFPAVSLKMAQDQSPQGEAIWVTIYPNQEIAGRLTVSQGNGTLTATFQTEAGTFTKTIPATTPVQYRFGSTEAHWWYPSDDPELKIGGYVILPDGIMATGVIVGPIPPAVPEGSFTVAFRALHP